MEKDAREVSEIEILSEERAVEILKARDFSVEIATCIERAIKKLEGLSSDYDGVVEIINYLHCMQLLPELTSDDEAEFMIEEAMNWAAKYEEGAMKNAEGHGLEWKSGEFSSNDVAMVVVEGADNCCAKYAERHGLGEEAENLGMKYGEGATKHTKRHVPDRDPFLSLTQLLRWLFADVREISEIEISSEKTAVEIKRILYAKLRKLEIGSPNRAES